MLSDAEILDINIIRYSPMKQRYGGHIPSISAVARETGVTRAAIYKALSRGSIGPSRPRLSDALEACQKGHRERSPVGVGPTGRKRWF